MIRFLLDHGAAVNAVTKVTCSMLCTCVVVILVLWCSDFSCQASKELTHFIAVVDCLCFTKLNICNHSTYLFCSVIWAYMHTTCFFFCGNAAEAEVEKATSKTIVVMSCQVVTVYQTTLNEYKWMNVCARNKKISWVSECMSTESSGKFSWLSQDWRQ